MGPNEILLEKKIDKDGHEYFAPATSIDSCKECGTVLKRTNGALPPNCPACQTSTGSIGHPQPRNVIETSCSTGYYKKSLSSKVEVAYCRMCGHKYSQPKVFVKRANKKCDQCGVPWDGGNIAIACGCGRHFALATDAVLYKGQYWTLKCLFLKTDKRMPRIIKKINDLQAISANYKKIKLKFSKMKKYLKSQPCSSCGHSCGNRFALTESGILCGKCKINLNRR